MAFVPVMVLGAGAGAVALKIRKGRPAMSERTQASFSARRALNDCAFACVWVRLGGF